MSKLTDVITLLYSYQQDDIDKLAKRLEERRRAVWINELSALAKTHGCGQLAGTPKGQDARELKRLSKRDAESIANTYNRELRNRVERLFKSNSRGNRSYYTSSLDKWAKNRDSWKSYQIALDTDGTTRHYVFSRFYQMNPQIRQAFVAVGAPPTCKLCIRIFAAGVVNYEYTQQNPLPRHIGCPHSYRAVVPTKVDCAKLWLG